MSKKNGRVITLEEFIIDTFTQVGEDGVERPVDRPDELGGGGTYGIIGARMFLPPLRLGMIVDYTADTLPHTMRSDLEQYGQDMWYFRQRGDGHPTTRSVNRYTKDRRLFEYLSKPSLLTPRDALDTPWTAVSAIHMISDCNRLESFEKDMSRVREDLGRDWDPRIVWEPNPADAKPSSIPVFERITPQVDVLSPNHSELLSLLSLSTSLADTDIAAEELKMILESAARTLLSWKPRLGVVIRCGALGACFCSSLTSSMEEEVEWVPAYWSAGAEEADWESRIVDPTGAGNAFCGAMAAALDKGEDLREAVLWGNVAASFVIEQHGLPKISEVEGREVWAGTDDPRRRVDLLKRRWAR